jgi:hypothetical protein
VPANDRGARRAVSSFRRRGGRKPAKRVAGESEALPRRNQQVGEMTGVEPSSGYRPITISELARFTHTWNQHFAYSGGSWEKERAGLRKSCVPDIPPLRRSPDLSKLNFHNRTQHATSTMPTLESVTPFASRFAFECNLMLFEGTSLRVRNPHGPGPLASEDPGIGRGLVTPARPECPRSRILGHSPART